MIHLPFPQLVADPPDCDHVAGLSGVVLNLVPQPAHMYVHCIFLSIIGIVPDEGIDLLFGIDLFGIL